MTRDTQAQEVQRRAAASWDHDAERHEAAGETRKARTARRNAEALRAAADKGGDWKVATSQAGKP